jgi:hypothetical protein
MLTPDDRAALAALPTRVSADTSYARFHGVVRVLTPPRRSIGCSTLNPAATRR